MKIDEAIKTLKGLDSHLKGSISPDFRGAVKLGVEALERTRSNRLPGFLGPFIPLPSETKE